MFKPLQLLYAGYRRGLRHPKYRGWVVGGTLLWLLNPINAIPIVGEIDDAVVLTILVSEMAQVVMENRKSVQPQAAISTLDVES